MRKTHFSAFLDFIFMLKFSSMIYGKNGKSSKKNFPETDFLAEKSWYFLWIFPELSENLSFEKSVFDIFFLFSRIPFLFPEFHFNWHFFAFSGFDQSVSKIIALKKFPCSLFSEFHTFLIALNVYHTSQRKRRISDDIFFSYMFIVVIVEFDTLKSSIMYAFNHKTVPKYFGSSRHKVHANNKTTTHVNHPHCNLIIKYQLTVNFVRKSWTLQPSHLPGVHIRVATAMWKVKGSGEKKKIVAKR